MGEAGGAGLAAAGGVNGMGGGRRRGRALALVALGAACVASVMPGGALAETIAEPSRLAQAPRSDGVRLTVAPTIAAAPASQVPFAIRIAPADAMPRNSFLRVRGLPPTVSLSDGYAIAPGSWAVPLHALSGLALIVPVGAAGRSEIGISLVGEDGTLLAEARSILLVEPSAASAAPREQPAQPAQPAPPRGPLLTPADRETAEKLVARGEREIEQGQVAVARNFFLRAAQIGLARAALLLAATYDPRELARWGVRGVQPNVGEARKWYERARELGAPEAEERLARLGAG